MKYLAISIFASSLVLGWSYWAAEHSKAEQARATACEKQGRTYGMNWFPVFPTCFPKEQS